MESIDEAEAKRAALRDILPQRATKATVDAYRWAIELLADMRGSRPWLEAHGVARGEE